jgi:hypothetical protein
MNGSSTIEATSGATGDGADSRLPAMERRYEELLSELAELRSKLRQLRTQEEYCELCGGTGIRNVKGGMYGEVLQFPCSCGQG